MLLSLVWLSHVSHLIFMKNTLIFALLLTGTMLSAQGIEFSKNNWNDILAQAKQENKIVFVDAYTTWCGPCKMMSRDVFPLAQVGDFYNANFINAKIDMERGEGPKLAAKYEVSAYPTYLFVSPDGELLHKNMGYLPGPKFIAVGEAAIDPKRQSAKLAMRFVAGDRSPELLRNYAMASHENGDRKYTMLALKYMDTQKDWSTRENMEFLMKYADNFDDQPMQYLLENRDKFNQEFGQETVDKHLQMSISKKLYGGSGKPLTLEDVDATYRSTFPDQADRLSLKFRMNYYERAQDLPKFVEVVENYMDTYGSTDWQELNGYAWAFYELVDDKAKLEKALNWALTSTGMESNYYNTDTVAALYYKLGKQKNAKEYALKAIKHAQDEGHDPKPTVDLLYQINQM